MASGKVVHVLTRHESALSAALTLALEKVAEVRCWESLPRGVAFPPGVLVVDLEEADSSANQLAVLNLNERIPVWVVTGRSLIDSVWLEIARRPRTRVVRFSGDRGPEDLERLVGALRREMCGEHPSGLAHQVLEAEPFFEGVASLVKAVCERPSEVRRPRDLAVSARVSMHELKAECEALGFRRVEHFIVCVKMLELGGTRRPVSRSASSLPTAYRCSPTMSNP